MQLNVMRERCSDVKTTEFGVMRFGRCHKNYVKIMQMTQAVARLVRSLESFLILSEAL